MTMGFRFRGAFRKGHESWRRGDLDEAERHLREAHRLRPRGGGALLYLARVLSERGDPAGALRALDEARDAGASQDVAGVFARLVRYDHDETASDADAPPPSATQNVLSRSLETLVDLRKRLLGGPESPEAASLEARLPLAARWIAEVTGRVLALLDRAAFLRDRDGWLRLHHDLLAEATFGIEPEEGPDVPPGNAGRPEEAGPRDIVAAFLRRDYSAVEGLSRDDEILPGPLLSVTAVCRTFSLLALGKPAEALRAARTIDEDPACAPEARFLEGLTHTVSGRIAEAGWCFTRAARYRDIEVDQVLQRVSSALSLRWEWDE